MEDKEIEGKKVDRLWQWGLHEDNLFINRLPFFIIVQTVLFATTVAFIKECIHGRQMLYALTILTEVAGIVFTCVIWYIQLKHEKYIHKIQKKLRKLDTTYSEIRPGEDRLRWLEINVPCVIFLILWAAALVTTVCIYHFQL